MFVIQTNSPKRSKFISKIWISNSSSNYFRYNNVVKYTEYRINFTNNIRRALAFDTKQNATVKLNKLSKIIEGHIRDNINTGADDYYAPIVAACTIVEAKIDNFIEFSARSNNPKNLPIRLAEKNSSICSFCKVYIPASFPFIQVNSHKVCGFCVKIMHDQFDYSAYAPHEDAYKAERLIKSL